MNPVSPEELSGLLDGELDPVRAREVEAQLAFDPVLRREFERLSAADAAWQAASRSAALTVNVGAIEGAASAGRAGRLCGLPALIGLLVVARIVLKLAGSEAWAIALPAVALLLLLAGVVRVVGTELRAAGAFPAARE